ncbi:hypothetical protein PR048_006653 [Dryococelus australis]|uniref:Uncharacterized protein n=1 Tax=Dryococelus australis TaxID=614101 RepID=A0ABQ9IBM0_9NEOP|nr:hypothetical protein PR048_006653 [Dryococelus australis]
MQQPDIQRTPTAYGNKMAALASDLSGRNLPISLVTERLARSPPTRANPVQAPAGSPDFRKWESCRMMPLVGGFSHKSPVSPTPSFRRCSIFTSITLIGSQELAVKSRRNLFILNNGSQGTNNVQCLREAKSFSQTVYLLG